jgi:intracellular sulfur oxidation DsrE/DsrF family protein
MNRITQTFLALSILLIHSSVFCADNSAPWGSAEVLDIKYKPNKVLYDLTSGNKNDIVSVLDRISYLNKLYESDTFDSSIIVIVHGNAIPFFAINKFKNYQDIMRRAQSLTVDTSIEFRMCRAAARLLNYQPKDIHGFVKMVPMADAEIIRLQHDNYAYLN